MKPSEPIDHVKKSSAEQAGPTAIEYGLVAVIVVIAGIVAFETLGTGSLFVHIRSFMDSLTTT